jgi:hypothetical protein
MQDGSALTVSWPTSNLAARLKAPKAQKPSRRLAPRKLRDFSAFA